MSPTPPIDEPAGQEAVKPPDHIPAFYGRIGEVVEEGASPDVREAVRCVDDRFPITFLLPNESVRPCDPPMKGYSIDFRGSKIGASLGVPPGYWVVRDREGKLFLYADSDFRRAWYRLGEPEHTWTPAKDRFPAGTTQAISQVLKARQVGQTDRLERERDAERAAPRRVGTSERLALPPCTCLDPQDGAEHDDTCVRGAALRERHGGPEEPAEGTRRHLILSTIRNTQFAGTDFHRNAIELANAVEAALLRVEGATTDTTPEAATADPELADVRRRIARAREVDADRVHNLLDGWDIARSGPEPGDLDPSPDDGAAKYTLYQRVQELTGRLRRAEGTVRAGREGDEKMRGALARKSERIEELENQLENVRESLDRLDAPQAPTFAKRIGMLFRELSDANRSLAKTRDAALEGRLAVSDGDWKGTEPREGSRRELIREAIRNAGGICPGPGGPNLASLRLADAVESALLMETINAEAMAKGAEALTDGIKGVEPDADDEDELTDYERKLLEDREQARAGEGRLMEQRNASLRLLRWLIGDLVSEEGR